MFLQENRFKNSVHVEWSLGSARHKEEVTFLRRKKKKSGSSVLSLHSHGQRILDSVEWTIPWGS